MPSVRAKRATTAGRQARAGEFLMTHPLDENKRQRLIAALVMFGFVAIALALAVAAMDAAGYSQHEIVATGKFLSYMGIGQIFIAWKWPIVVYWLFRHAKSDQNNLNHSSGRLKHFIERTLSSRIQRLLFVLGTLGLLPWGFMRLVRETWRSHGLPAYLESVLISPITPWFQLERWYTWVEWFDWPRLPAVVTIAAAFAWPYTFAKVIDWVQSTSQ